ncbi:hypothetical protein DVH24_015918, partial [Malus domestica]
VLGLRQHGPKARGERGKAIRPGAEEEEGRSCYSSGHLKTGASSSDLGTNMKNKGRERDLYLQNTVTRSEMTGKALGVHGFAGKMGVLTPKRFQEGRKLVGALLRANYLAGQGPCFVESLSWWY